MSARVSEHQNIRRPCSSTMSLFLSAYALMLISSCVSTRVFLAFAAAFSSASLAMAISFAFAEDAPVPLASSATRSAFRLAPFSLKTASRQQRVASAERRMAAEVCAAMRAAACAGVCAAVCAAVCGGVCGGACGGGAHS